MKSRTQNSIRNIIVGLGGQGIETILKFIGRTVFINCLSVSYLGVNGLFGEILTMLSLAELGVGAAIGYALYKPLREQDKSEVSALMRLYKKAYTVIGIVVAFMGFAIIPFLDVLVKGAQDIQNEILHIYLFYLFNTTISYFYSYKTSLLVADQNNYIVQIIKEICNILRTVFQCIALLTFHSFYLYLCIESFFIVANNVWISLYVNKKYPYLKKSEFNKNLEKSTKKKIWSNIRALVLVKINTILVNSTDNTIISALGGIVEVGIYSNYSMFVTMFTNVLAQVFSNISASVGNLNAEGNKSKSMEVFQAIHMANFWLFSWVAIGIVILINPIISIWIGDNYLLPLHIVYIIAINFYIKGMQNAVWVFKDTFGLFKYGKYMAFVTSGINIGLSILLGMKYGLMGILGATAIARMCTGVWYDSYALFRHGFHKSVLKYYFEYICYGLLGLGTFILTYFICRNSFENAIFDIIFKMIIIIIVPNLVYVISLRKCLGFKKLLNVVNHSILKRK